MKVVVAHSGGIDSTVLLYHLLAMQYEPIALQVYYGQIAQAENRQANIITERLNIRSYQVIMTGYGEANHGNTLVKSSNKIADQREEKASVVHNRNAMFLSIAAGVAVSNGAGAIALGNHLSDYPIYKDCRPEFIRAFELMLKSSSEKPLIVLAPFVNLTKAEVIAYSQVLKVPHEITWSCYNGGEIQCGVCSSCVNRREAFKKARVEDRTKYAKNY